MCVCVCGSISVYVWEYVCVLVCVCLALTGRRQSMPDYVVVAVVLDVVAAANCAAHVAYANVQIAHMYSRYICYIRIGISASCRYVCACLPPYIFVWVYGAYDNM